MSSYFKRWATAPNDRHAVEIDYSIILISLSLITYYKAEYNTFAYDADLNG